MPDKEDLMILGFLGVITAGCLLGVALLESPPDLLTNIATMGFGAIVMKAKSIK
jgi:hypothetical protein